MHAVSRLTGSLGRGLAIFLALVLVSVAAGHAGDDLSAVDHGAPSLRQAIRFRVTDRLSAQTQAALFPRPDVAISLTQRFWSRAPEAGEEAAPHEVASLRLSQQIDPSRQQAHAFSRLAPGPWWADLLLEARAAPLSMLQLSATAAYDPTEAHLTRATAELRLQPFTAWTLSLAPDFGDGSRVERLAGGMHLSLPGAWTVSYTLHAPALDAAGADQTVTTLYRSSYGDVRLQLAQSPAETRVELLLDVAALLRRTLGSS